MFLGDYIDRGDDARSVLTELKALKEERSDDVVALRGNHEEALLAFLATPVAGKGWLNYGALQTLMSYGVAPPAKSSADDLNAPRDGLFVKMGSHTDFIMSLPCVFEFGDAVFAHAGIDPMDAKSLTTTKRCCGETPVLFQRALSPAKY